MYDFVLQGSMNMLVQIIRFKKVQIIRFKKVIIDDTDV